jgi:hypothetical protein
VGFIAPKLGFSALKVGFGYRMVGSARALAGFAGTIVGFSAIKVGFDMRLAGWRQINVGCYCEMAGYSDKFSDPSAFAVIRHDARAAALGLNDMAGQRVRR